MGSNAESVLPARMPGRDGKRVRERAARSTVCAAGSELRRARRSAFTLIEMLVSLAVVTVALAVVVTAFTITTRTARQASAISEVNNWLRQFTNQIEEDLSLCNPSEGILVLVGREQKAALTADDLAAGRYFRVLTGNPSDVPLNYSPTTDPNLDPPGADGASSYSEPRADIMMFFSNRPSVSQAPARRPDLAGTRMSKEQSYAMGAKFAPIQVVIGHAALGNATIQADGSAVFGSNVTHIENTIATGQSSIPAARWQLARRATIMEVLPDSGGVSQLDFSSPNDEFAGLVRCYTENNNRAADVATISLQPFLAQFSNLLRLSGDQGNPTNLRNTELTALNKVLYYPNGNTTNHHIATVIEEPPADLRSNLGLQMLPGCVWFQVEFLAPEDPRNSLDYPIYETPSPNYRQDMPRWTEVNAHPAAGPTTYVFVPDTAENRAIVAGQWNFAAGAPVAGTRLDKFAKVNRNLVPDSIENRRIRLWPYAVRITVRVTDPRGRLPEPVTRSIIHRFQ